MYGTGFAQGFARVSANSLRAAGRFFDRPDGVLAVVCASTLVTTGCSYVVLSNALDATAPAPRVEMQASAGNTPAPANAPMTLPSFDAFDVALGGALDIAPQVRSAPRLAPSVRPAPTTVETPDAATVEPYSIVAGRPPVLPLPRPNVTGPLEVVVMARNMSPARAATLPRPELRPEGTTTPAWPDAETGPQTSDLLAAASPRPRFRPEDLVIRVAAEPDGIEVARAEAPDATGLGGVTPSPRGGLFGGVAGNGECSTRLARAIPRRPGSASGGSSVMAAIGNGSGSGRDDRLVREALNGNVPSHIRDLHPVTLTGTVGGRSVEVTICVTPDYLAIGSDRDNVRVPLGLPAALQVAEAFDMMLPTTSMVDAIYRQADVRVAPSPMTPGSSMSSTNYFVRHDETLDGQFSRAGARPGQLVAGHKKDLVLANRLGRNPGRVAIYGWHRTNGNPIQPLSTVHGAYYADYSHGIRLVSRTAFVNGRAVDLRELLTDERYASFLNSDGALSGATVRLASL